MRRQARTTLRGLTMAVLAGVMLAGGEAAAQEPVAPQKNWRRLDAPHFQVLGNTGERDLRRVAEAFEQFRDAMGLLFPEAVRRVDLPTTVLVFKDHRSYTPFKPVYDGKPVEVGGYFVAGPDLNYITLTTENFDENLRTVYHEYVHLIVNTVQASLPLWANEGLAEYYSTFAVTGGGRQVALGRPVADHVLLLRERFMPLDELVATDHASQHYNEGSKRSIFYAESWALLHYLQFGEQQAHVDKVGRFLGALSSGTSFAEASRGVLGVEPGNLEKALRRYVQQSLFVSQTATFADRLAAMERLPVVAAAPAEVHATLGALLARLNRKAEARSQLAQALSLDPESPMAHSTLGVLLLREDDEAQALAHLERASRNDSASFLTQFYFAQGLQRLVAQAGDPGRASAQAAQMEAALRRAIELRPGFTESYHLLAHLKSRDPATIDEAVALMARATLLAPGRDDYALMTAMLHANKQRFVPARAIASRLASRATDARVRQQARDLVTRIAAYEEQKAQFEARGAAPVSPSAYFAPTTGGARFIPALRALGEGERRLYGLLTAIDCAADGSVLLRVAADGTTHVTQAASFDAVDFITYRTDLEGSIPCGARERPQVVYVSWRPAQPATEGVVGEAVALEFLPDGFVPVSPQGERK